MAWVTHGSILNIDISENKKNPKLNTKKTTTVNVNCADADCLALMLIHTEKSDNNAVYYEYQLQVYKQKTEQLSKSGNAQAKTVIEYPNNPSQEPIINITRPTNFDKLGSYLRGNEIYTNITAVHELSTAIPIFNDYKALQKYITKGDTSGAVIDASTKWNLYIDGTKNPLYKLTWNCPDITSSDTSKVKILLCGYEETVGAYIVKDTRHYEYNKKSVKLNYHDIREAVWGDAGGGVKSPVTIIVQFEYFETTTVVPKATSSYMYCELYPSETNGHMYGDIGFCKVGDHSTWFVKTTDGDSSTFTAHDGTKGSEGYTKDDDKGYEDNKDKDDADNDTAVLSSGIGVLTSTFHMTKERLVQLGQFLWGASIFDEFSLINNNPIENIISCKAIPYAISGTTQEITLGNVKTGVNGEKISQNFSKQTIGSVAIAEHYKNFLDYAPYTNVIIYLPYIGFKELDTSLVMGKTLRIEYTLDVITGGCLAQIYVGNIRLYEFTGNIGVDISITASNRAQVESAYINAGVGIVSSAMSGNVTGAVNSIIGAATSQYHYSGTGNPSPSCVASTNRTCYVVIDRPQYQPLKAFNHTRGRMCCLSKTIGSLNGFTVCDGNVDISGISATDEEKEEIVNILSSGFFAYSNLGENLIFTLDFLLKLSSSL